MKKCIILANGKTPKKSVIKYLESIGYNTLICADGGADSAFKLKLIPDYIIGDLDSVSEKTLEYYSDKCEIIRYERQNDTDVEKCLKFAIKKKFNEIILLGATGNRLDHSFCNLGIVLKFFEKVKIRIIHEKSYLEAVKGKIEFNAVANETISLYGFDSGTKIKSSGLKYPLKNISLPFGEKESTSNVASSDKVKLSIKGGKIFIIRDYKTMRENGFICGS
ncbi:MAG: thiamine diphosphokinase [Melioribacteraceae bacterium]|nr:thiamine diphosphokinase [Melioribacteraceae bacterium]